MGVSTELMDDHGDVIASWKDVVPIAQDDGPAPVVSIQYSSDFRQIMGYFRAILQSNELSERALALTKEVIRVNAGNYTAWHFRRQCLVALKKDLRVEMEFLNNLADENPKNYQLWHHRRAVAEMIGGDGKTELVFSARAIEQDSKNYHAWSHRQWAISHFSLWA